MTTVQNTTALETTSGLRLLADMIEANPELAEALTYSLGHLLVSISHRDDPRALMGAFARAGKNVGAQIDKVYDDTYGAIDVHLSEAVVLHVYAARGEVCERIVTGTREITEQVPDPDALRKVPTVERTRTEDIVEWRCRPLLAEEQDEQPAAVSA